MTQILVRATSTAWRRFSTGAVLLPGEATEPLLLNAQGAEVWDIFDEPTSFDDAVAELSNRYGLPPATIGRDVQALVDHLVAAGALATA